MEPAECSRPLVRGTLKTQDQMKGSTWREGGLVSVYHYTLIHMQPCWRLFNQGWAAAGGAASSAVRAEAVRRLRGYLF